MKYVKLSILCIISALILCLSASEVGGSAVEDSNDGNHKKAKKNKWASLTDKDLDRLEKEWDQEDEDEDAIESEKFKKRLDEGALGATMMFINMKGSPSDTEVQEFTGRVTAMARTGGVHVQAFKMADGKIVVTLQKGWQGLELYDWLKQLDEVLSIEWGDLEKARAYEAKVEAERKRKLLEKKNPKAADKEKKKKKKKSKKKQERDEL